VLTDEEVVCGGYIGRIWDVVVVDDMRERGGG